MSSLPLPVEQAGIFPDPQSAIPDPTPKPPEDVPVLKKNRPATFTAWANKFNAQAYPSILPMNDQIIDVMPDQRFPFLYCSYYTMAQFTSLNVSQSTVLSPMSMMAYLMLNVNGTFLINDRDHRKPTSLYAAIVTENDQNSNLMEAIENMIVPEAMEMLVTQYNQVRMSRRPRLVYCASLASALNPLDWGRLYPVQSFLSGHNILANEPMLNNPLHMLNAFYMEQIADVDGAHLFNASLYGTHYAVGNNVIRHNNWMSNMIATLFSPATARNQLRRSNVGPIPVGVYAPADNHWNPYEFTIGFGTPYRNSVASFIRTFSEYIQDMGLGTKTLLELNRASATANCIQNCFTGPPSLPTFDYTADAHPVGEREAERYANTTNAEFAARVHFGIAPLEFPEMENPHRPDARRPLAGCNLIMHEDYVRNDDPIEYDAFADPACIYPDVMLYMPYTTQVCIFANVCMSGIHIESAGIRAAVVPIPSPVDNPIIVNSQFLNATFRADRTIYPGTRADVPPFVQNVPLPFDAQPVAVVMRRFDINPLMQFPFDHVNLPADGEVPAGFVAQPGHNDHRDAYTYTAGLSNGTMPIPLHRVVLWSSYRYRTLEGGNNEQQVRIFYTQAAIFGSNITTARVPFPALIMPARP